MRISLNEILTKESQISKNNLFSDLRKSRPAVNKFILMLLRQRRLIINENYNSSHSILKNKIQKDRPYFLIEWGIGNEIQKTLEREIFDYRSFKLNDLKQYRLLQQICLCLYLEYENRNNPNFKSLVNILENQFKIDRKFFTQYGSFYDSMEHSSTPTKYDLAELFCIYLWDLNYFNKYFRFILSQEENDLALKKAYSIRSLAPSNAKIIEELLNNIFETKS